ncbi:unnamed protein product [Clonostachys solani]|uniref:Heterokaryon incompatibility domain-containing protein n=1 Tax=Clonostachys solani TaxID=160281 RepID=A0A9N9W943_9HYPO|nr:unnamed protein product [Clonostachys solani]
METEVRSLIPENIDHVISVLRSISEYLEPWNQASQVIPDLTQWRMFPVNPKGGTSAKVELQAASDFWCIPVALDHQRGFLGKVNISVIFADTFSGISQLCGYLKLDSKFMSRLINEKSAHHHGVRLHEGYMERLRGKALYIASLIPLRYQTKYVKLLKNLFVYQCDQILINWHLRVGEEVVQSHPVEDQVTVEIRSGELSIHMVDKDSLLNSGYSPMQLSHLMADVCKINRSRDFSLLIQILAQDKPKLIEADLHFHLKETGRTRFKEPFKSGDDAISMPQTSMPPQQKNTATRVTTQKEDRIQVLPFDNQQDDTPSSKMQEPIEGETGRIDSQPVPKASKNTLDSQIQNPVGHVSEDAVDAVTGTDDHPIAHKEQHTSNGLSGPISDTEDRSVEQLSPTKIEAPTNVGKSISSTTARGPINNTEASCQYDTIRILDGTEPCQKDEFGNRQAQQESSDEHAPAFSESPKADKSHLLENARVHNVRTEIADAAEEAPSEGNKLMVRGYRSSPRSDQQEVPPSTKLEAESISVQLDSLPAKDTPLASKDEEEIVEEFSGLKVPSIAIERAELPEDTKVPLIKPSETPSYRSGPPSSIRGDQHAQQEFGTVLKTMRPSSPYAKRALSPSRYLPSSDREVDYLSTQPHRRTNHEFMNMNSGFVHYHEPTTIFTGRDTEETRNFGELYVSEYLRKLLPETYDPSKHWTSRQRSRSFTPPTPDCSTFTIPDASGKLLEAVIEGGHINRALLEKPCTIHVEVCASNDGLYSTFILPNVQFEKARRMTMSKDQKFNQIYILARVYKVREDPGIAMYVDPWHLYLHGSLSLQSASRFLGAISKSKTLRPILHQESTRASFTSKSHVVYHDLPVGPREIRLLKLDLNKYNEPLRGSLQVCNVSDANHYWALSYVWGPNPTELHPIYFTVDGKEMMITESLSAFLKQLRRKLRDGGTNSVPPLLWADALCIDQNNNVEKSQQVSNMGSIFGEAKQVMVWAGTENENDTGVIEVFAWLHEQLFGHRDTKTCRCRDTEQPSTDHLPNDEDPCWPAIEAFLRREWFVRVWIIQELVLGSDVTLMCGERETRWDCFAQTLSVCERYLNQGDHGRHYLPSSGPALSLHGVRKLYQGRRKFRFLQLIDKFYLSQSTWRRDRLFALLNLASDADFNTSDFQPDYDSGDENVLAVYARGFVRLGLAPDLLYRAGSGKACPSCSWIPDFMRRRSGNPPYPPTISTWQAKSGQFSAGSRNIRKKPTVHFIKPSVPEGGLRDYLQPVLVISGYEIDTVTGCQPLNINPSHGSVSFETLHIVRKHLKFYLRGRSEKIVINLLIGDALRPQPFYAGQESAELDEWPPGFEEKLLRAIDPDQDGREYDKVQVEDRRLNLKFWATVRAFAGRIPGAARKGM